MQEGQIWVAKNSIDQTSLGNFVLIIEICNNRVAYKYLKSGCKSFRSISNFKRYFSFSKKHNTKLYKSINNLG